MGDLRHVCTVQILCVSDWSDPVRAGLYGEAVNGQERSGPVLGRFDNLVSRGGLRRFFVPSRFAS